MNKDQTLDELRKEAEIACSDPSVFGSYWKNEDCLFLWSRD